MWGVNHLTTTFGPYIIAPVTFPYVRETENRKFNMRKPDCLLMHSFSGLQIWQTSGTILNTVCKMYMTFSCGGGNIHCTSKLWDVMMVLIMDHIKKDKGSRNTIYNQFTITGNSLKTTSRPPLQTTAERRSWSQLSGKHSCFVFGRYRLQISAWRPTIQTGVS
jgi:hypothetical protein